MAPGDLGHLRPVHSDRITYLEGPRGPRPVARVGPFVATLMNGVFGDPLLHVRIPFHKRSVLVDIGEGAKLPARAAHQVTDLFLSHAHADHITGFLSFLRSRIGEWPVCRVYGPRGIVENVAGLVSGIHWDRVGLRAPRFEVTELGDDLLECFSIVAGEPGYTHEGQRRTSEGLIWSDTIMSVRATVLDHLTPVLAFALESRATLKVRKEKLVEAELAPGPWLTELKDLIAAGRHDAPVLLPDGRRRAAGALAEDLLLAEPGEKLVYATDLADTERNRSALTALAEGSHTLFCEATFCEAQAHLARRTGHLTAKACGEIATAARVRRLIPFHFSRRYESDPLAVYEEVRSACAATVIPTL
jgi:ribonuclease Z